MATCNYASVYPESCDNGFATAASDEVLARAIELQLLYLRSGGSETVGQLYDQACVNRFTALAKNEIMANAVELQLYCNISGGTP